jgi:hypothetical protein
MPSEVTYVYRISCWYCHYRHELLKFRLNYLSIYEYLCLYSPLLDLGRFFSFLISIQLVGLLGGGISMSQSSYLHTEQHKQNKRAQTSMPQVGFQPTIPCLSGRRQFMSQTARLLWSAFSSQSHITTDSQSASLSWCRTPSGAYDQKFVLFCFKF